MPAAPDTGTIQQMAYPSVRYSPPTKKLKPAALRTRLESARLDLRALYRTLDRMSLAQDLPDELRRLLELDADLAEALWVLGQPRGGFDLSAMTRDTLSSLDRLGGAREALLGLFDGATREQLEGRARLVRSELAPADAYLEIPGGGRGSR